MPAGGSAFSFRSHFGEVGLARKHEKMKDLRVVLTFPSVSSHPPPPTVAATSHAASFPCQCPKSVSGVGGKY